MLRPASSPRHASLAVLLLSGTLGFNALPASAADTTTPKVEVVGVSPVKGMEVPRNEVPLPVQSISAEAMENRRLQNLPEIMSSRLNGVNINETNTNPYQSDVNYRGFTASPLLGTPQGLSVYQDGVRINEPFGDTVNWDLIPLAALKNVDLIPGSNPLFGLNTLGGALSMITKGGLTDPGFSLEGSAGSFGRREVEAEFGKGFGDVGVFVSGSAFREKGWRDFSPSAVDQAFAKFSQRQRNIEVDLSFTGARTDLTGNGLLPDSMLKARRQSIYTKPDNTKNNLQMLSGNGSFWFDNASRLSGSLYLRHTDTTTLNGDVNDDYEDQFDNTGNNTGANNRTWTRQRGMGGAMQWTNQTDKNQLALGTTVDKSIIHFRQSREYGTLDSERGVIGNGILPGRSQVLISGQTLSWSLFASDTYRPQEDLAITSSLRFNHSHVLTRDHIRGGMAGSLESDYKYRKLNPSLGATWMLTPAVTMFANAAQGNRAPSPIELGCADRNNPCSLPNSMQADPFLKQVITRTFEAGIRGGTGSTRWNATLFLANNYDDIVFIGTGGNNSQGYFTNFGKTRREGIELGAAAEMGRVALRADYSYVKATYQSSACILAENNSTRGQGGCAGDEIRVLPGHRLPGIPLHNLKLGADWKVDQRVTLSADVVAHSSQFLRGNENNAHQAGTFGGRTFLGSGEAAAYTVLNLAARVKFDKSWTMTARINNALNKKYATAGALAENAFNAAGTFQTNSDDWTRESFYAPGAPRSIFVGLALAFH